MRADGVPSAVAVASVMAFASSGSCVHASFIHSRKRANGSMTRGVLSGMARASLQADTLCRRERSAPSGIAGPCPATLGCANTAGYGRSRKGSTLPDRAPAKGTAMQGKRGLIMGVTNDRSLGWGIAAACAAQGAELAFTYQVEALGRRVRPLAESVGSDRLFLCDVGDEASIDAAFAALREHWDGLDFLVHAIAFADKQYLP